ncbi:DUF1833 family protein [Rickettsia endosymbiont of Cardiosporidium cionae]|uniref:DUF1833 family protein n=1 Tax=Rickettsia endosymbiont of Cardiosporidium cionae TaxID=2777155 RepID=UPI0018934448|nr:DUF1833 family protein [Rickettsia endosymbiont of Cardiosporidium cionae]KAF8818088.1 hypothetical protein IHI24_000887 [Rickettsia endosymbiont of Cardiosporidium cionae]
MANTQLSKALEEAYASAPADNVILNTIELHHPDFLDELGQAQAIRMVQDKTPLLAVLEDDAPKNAGEIVQFEAIAFELKLPKLDTTPVPEITVSIDNVSRELMPFLEIAATSQDRIDLIYRPYLFSDLSEPQMNPPLKLVLYDIEASILRITGKAKMLDVGNIKFPTEEYNLNRFPGLRR